MPYCPDGEYIVSLLYILKKILHVVVKYNFRSSAIDREFNRTWAEGGAHQSNLQFQHEKRHLLRSITNLHTCFGFDMMSPLKRSIYQGTFTVMKGKNQSDSKQSRYCVSNLQQNSLKLRTFHSLKNCYFTRETDLYGNKAVSGVPGSNIEELWCDNKYIPLEELLGQ